MNINTHIYIYEYTFWNNRFYYLNSKQLLSFFKKGMSVCIPHGKDICDSTSVTYSDDVIRSEPSQSLLIKVLNLLVHFYLVCLHVMIMMIMRHYLYAHKICYKMSFLKLLSKIRNWITVTCNKIDLYSFYHHYSITWDIRNLE